MIKSYIKIAFRQILKHKLFSLLNIFGLAMSMSVCLLLIMVLADQYGYDEFHKNKDRLYRVLSARQEKAIPILKPRLATSSLVLKDKLKEEYGFIENTTRILQFENSFNVEGKVLYTDNTGYVVDPSFLKMFSFGWIEGNEATALSQPNSIVLTQEAADKIFPDGNALGQVFEYGDMGNFTITGIMPQPPIRSHIYFDYLISYATVTAMDEENKKRYSVYDEEEGNIWRGLVYVLLSEDGNRQQLEEVLAQQATAYSERNKHDHYLFQSQAMLDVMPSPGMGDLGNDIGTGTPSVILYFLMSLGFLLMIAACFNYMNLSVARSLKRAKEIGIRKVVGARKKDLIFQFLGEAILISLLSLMLALIFLEGLIPAFYGLDPFLEDAFYLKRTPLVYLSFFLFSLFIGLIAGIFPAFNISSFQPIQAIKQLADTKLFSRVGIRKALVTGQFALSLIFILIVIIVLQQRSHVLNADLGLKTKNLLSVWVNEEVDFDVFSQQIQQIPGVENVSSSSSAMLVGGNSGNMVHFNNRSDSMHLNFNMVAQNYVDFMDIEMLAGENFPKGVNTKDEQFIVLNETATKRMGFETPADALGVSLMMSDDSDEALKVIGITKDFHHDNIWFSTIQPFALRQGGNFQNKLDIRIKEGTDSETLKAIRDTWDGLSPNTGITSFFTDTRMYHLDKFFRMGSSIIGFIGFLTIIISCMGLLGMVIYTVEGRLKEVGIRKILGASEGSLNWHLAKSFMILLGIAILIATPLTILVANLWLDNFVIRMSISPWMIIVGIGIILGMALLTVFSQTSFAARSNPVDVLRNE